MTWQDIEAGKRLVYKFGTPELIRWLEGSKAGNSPQLVMFLSRISNELYGPPPPMITKQRLKAKPKKQRNKK